MEAELNKSDIDCIKGAIELATSAVKNNNYPFGALLANQHGEIMVMAKNTAKEINDCTRHSCLNLVSKASQKISQRQLNEATLYSSTEPCVMCAGAIMLAGIRRVVFACSAKEFHKVAHRTPPLMTFAEICDKSGYKIEIIGPVFEEEAVAIHSEFWPVHNTHHHNSSHRRRSMNFTDLSLSCPAELEVISAPKIAD
eukprot:TRINITY_DN6585_c0_g1_i1.p1 TRINITY_DN6585_c0_g1~~TRINITY_DN6585_c0_g1_i1.p1  ORF type:complete len:197 (+),score=1.60 TRINITY_DN6585_c0_g1_i1:25-615(+)